MTDQTLNDATYGDSVPVTGPFTIAAARPGQSGTMWVNDGGVANSPWSGSGEGRELSFIINSVHYPASYDAGLRGRFEYDTGDGQWHTLLVLYQDGRVNPSVDHDNGGTPAPYGATIRYVDERPNDDTTQEIHIRFFNPVTNSGFTSSSFKVAADLAPTGIEANTLNLWSNSAAGDDVATLSALDTGTTVGGLYELVDQSQAGLFEVDGNMLVKGSGELAAGQTASVTLRYYDAFSRYPDGTPIPGQGVEQTLTFTGRANPTGLGPEVHVNTTTDGQQDTPQVAVQADGSYMIAWASAFSVRGQKFDAAGARVGEEFLIAADSHTPAIAALDDGSYAVAYVHNQDNVKVRLVDAGGTVGAAIDGPSDLTGYQWYPVMTKLADGGFAVAWATQGANNNWDIMSRAFDADGVAVPGSEAIVHGSSDGWQWNAGIGTLDDGNYVVTWESKDGSFGARATVMAQVMGASGPVGSAITVAAEVADSVYAKVAGLAGGGFVVVYEASGTTEGGVTDSDRNHNVFARIYDESGNPDGPAFVVSADVAGNQVQAVVTGLDDGGFAIAWVSSTDPEGNGDVFGRSFDADGTPRQDYDILLNETGRSNYQGQLAVAAHGGGGFVATWLDTAGDGPGDYGIVARVVDPDGGNTVNHKPQLSRGATLDAILEDVASLNVEDVSDSANPPPNRGTDVADLVDDSGYADPDGDPLAGVAISGNTANPLTQGRWQYSNDPDGKFWKDIGTVSATSAVLLPAGATTTHIRFVPVADFNGAPGGLTVHAIDATGGDLPFSRWNGAVETGQRIDLTDLDASSPVSNGVAWGIQVTAVNDAPVIANLGSADNQSIAASAGAVPLDLGTAVVVTDVDSADFAGGALSVMMSDRQGGDVLALATGGAVSLSAGMTTGSIVSVDGVSVGTIGPGDGNDQDLVVLFNAGANAASVTKLIRALTFDAGPTAGERHVSVVVSDGDGGMPMSNPATTVITVTANPTVTIGADRTDFAAGERAGLTFTFSDVPNGFAEDDISISGGTLDDFAATSDPKVYTATFTPNAGENSLAASVSIAAGKFTDADNRDNLASNVLSLTGDTAAPVVRDANLWLSGGTGTGGTYRIGDQLVATWNNSASGDNNLDLANVTFDLSQFGGSANASAIQQGGHWSVTHTITAGAIDALDLNFSVRAEDTAGNVTVRADSTGATVDNVAPNVSGAAISLSGATGVGGVFLAGDTVTATWTGEGHGDLAAVGFDFSQFGGGPVVGVATSGGWSASHVIANGVAVSGAGVTVSATDDAGNTASHDGGSANVDASRPTVTSITPVTTPGAGDSTRSYTVVFSEAVDGVEPGDFLVATTGSATGNLAGINGSGTTWTVDVDQIGGRGTLALTLKDDSGILDAVGNLLADGTSSDPAAVGANTAPVIGAHGGGGSGAIEVAEARTAVTAFTATDADQDPLAYSITGGADAALFGIDAATGALRFLSAPLAATPTDAGADGVYDVTVTVSDGFGGADSQSLAVTVLADLDRDGIADIHDDDLDNDGGLNDAETAVPSAWVDGAVGPTGDGNGDGLADNTQRNVTSLQTAGAGAPYATVAVGDGLVLSAVAASAAPTSGLPRNVKLPLGQLEFTIGQVAPGGTVQVSVYVDATEKVNSYFKMDNTGKWVNIAKSFSTVGTKTRITFDLVDGGVLDADGTVNGSISDPGGVAMLTPLITSNGGAVTATTTVREGARVVTAVTATAEAAVVYTLGGADAALFEIDQATGVLRFREAPDYDKPQDTGGAAHDNSYVVEVTATDSHGADTQTLTVNVARANTPPVGNPAPTPSTVDGVHITTGTIINSSGGTSQVITVPVVQPGRVDQVGGNDVADIPLVKDAGGVPLLSVQVPTGMGLEATGSGAPRAAGDSLADLIREIQEHTDDGSRDQASLTGGGSSFLSNLAAGTPLLVQTIVPTAAAGAAGPDGALVITGASPTAGNPLTALVIDARGLPKGATLELQNVEFAAVIGEVRVTGGAGAQTVWGDGEAQYLVLGDGDDVLHGGAGNDTVGSGAGNDRIYGDAGDDLVFGGQGDDFIDGGSGRDTLLLAGAGRAEYTLRVKDGMLEVKHLVDGADGTDLVAGIEVLRFGPNGPEIDFNASEVAHLVRLYSAAFDRQADTGGINHWIAMHEAGMALHDIADYFMGTQEAVAMYGSLSNEAFVARLYQVALHREGDASGMAFWTGTLDSGVIDRGDVLWNFAASDENVGLVGVIDTSVDTI
ncbi:DUF4214 domain-containing protein [Telluria beijingensis]|uniref:DUF4214 domain-containing protein n=1 Tax=Telluria beijingensis TaxID=3068633 RepID=UPI0027959D0E|nr:DUF4214 domain-containing protein [Massilia sp. REN29]